MPEDYPNNSHSARINQNGDQSQEKKFEKVVSGNAKTKKKSEARKIAGIFVPDDVNNVKSYIVNDVIIPGIKRAIADVVSIVLFGETGRVGGGRKSGGSSASYQRYWDDRRDDRREYARPRTSGFDFDDIVFETRGDAEAVLDNIEDAIDQYGMASVADLFDMAGVTCTAGFPANKYGWTDVRDARVVRVHGGYILSLPRTAQIT